MPVHDSPKPQARPYSQSSSGPHLIPVPPSARNPEEHLIIGRTNAEIFRVALVLIRNGVKARIVRRKEDYDILKNLTDYISHKTAYLRKAHKPPILQNLVPLLQKDKREAQAKPYRQGAVLYEKANCLLELKNEILSAARPSPIPTLLRPQSPNPSPGPIPTISSPPISFAPTPSFSDPLPVSAPTPTPTIDLLLNLLGNLCAESADAVRCCTIHKAKGLEADFVYILFPPIAHPLATSPNDLEQEKNLEFVSETRSRFYKAYVKDE